jgi:hypothetical protein
MSRNLQPDALEPSDTFTSNTRSYEPAKRQVRNADYESKQPPSSQPYSSDAQSDDEDTRADPGYKSQPGSQSETAQKKRETGAHAAKSIGEVGVSGDEER